MENPLLRVNLDSDTTKWGEGDRGVGRLGELLSLQRLMNAQLCPEIGLGFLQFHHGQHRSQAAWLGEIND